MGFSIDKIEERIGSGAVTFRRNGDGGFLAVSKRFCELTSQPLDDEFETLSLEGVDLKKEQTRNEIAALEQQEKNLLQQIETVRAEAEKRRQLLPSFDFLKVYHQNFEKGPKKEKK